MVCNRCDIIVKVFEDAKKVSVLPDESCSECEAQIVKVCVIYFSISLIMGHRSFLRSREKERTTWMQGLHDQIRLICKVTYAEGKTKLQDDKLQAEGCIFCDKDLSALVEKHHAVFLRRRQGGGGGGPAGKARGGRRGGRGRAKKQPKDKMSQLAAYFV